MARVRFEKGARVVWEELVYVIEERLEGDKFMLKNLSLGGLRTATRQELLMAWAAGKLVFETFGSTAVTSPDQRIATSYTVADFRSLPKEQQYIAWRRYQYVLPFAGLPPSQRNRQAIAAYLKANSHLIEERAQAWKTGFKSSSAEAAACTCTCARRCNRGAGADVRYRGLCCRHSDGRWRGTQSQ